MHASTRRTRWAGIAQGTITEGAHVGPSSGRAGNAHNGIVVGAIVPTRALVRTKQAKDGTLETGRTPLANGRHDTRGKAAWRAKCLLNSGILCGVLAFGCACRQGGPFRAPVPGNAPTRRRTVRGATGKKRKVRPQKETKVKRNSRVQPRVNAGRWAYFPEPAGQK